MRNAPHLLLPLDCPREYLVNLTNNGGPVKVEIVIYSPPPKEIGWGCQSSCRGFYGVVDVRSVTRELGETYVCNGADGDAGETLRNFDPRGVRPFELTGPISLNILTKLLRGACGGLSMESFICSARSHHASQSFLLFRPCLP